MPDVEGAPASVGDAGTDVVVRYLDRQVRFAPFGGKIEAKLRSNQFYEGELLHYIESLQLRGSYIDVGGYVGTHALFLGTYCPADRVHTFEPRGHCFDHLRRNVEANHLAGTITAHRLGLSDKDETISLTLAGKTELIGCHPLDQLIDEPVCLMKIDVEGMEEKVLGGCARTLRAHKPLIFVEAHTQDELDRDLAALAPYGYRLTGRVFNASPTYELAADDSPTAGADRLPTERSLLDARLWHPESDAIDATVVDGRLVISSRLDVSGEVKSHVTQKPSQVLRRAPGEDLVEVSPSSTYFVQAIGQASEHIGAAIFVMEYDDGGRIGVHKYYFHPRLFQRIELAPGTRRFRVAIRLSGPGTLTLDRFALHVLARRDAQVGVAAVVAEQAVPGAVVLDRTTKGNGLSQELAGLAAPVVRDPGDSAAGAAPVMVVVQDLPSTAEGSAARGPFTFDGTLAPRVVHIVLFDDVHTVLDRGVLATATAAGWELVAASTTTHAGFPFALAFARSRSVSGPIPEGLGIRNERRFAELMVSRRTRRPATATPRKVEAVASPTLGARVDATRAKVLDVVSRWRQRRS